MSACTDQSGTSCKNIQLLEPDDELLSAISSGSQDTSLDEHGELALDVGQTRATVVFTRPKASNNYRFEYLYVDALQSSINDAFTPGIVEFIPIIQSQFGFTINLAGTPLTPGSVLRWRVIVIDLIISPTIVDAPERLYLQMPYLPGDFPIPRHPVMNVLFVNPRSTIDYGFSELRVENLVDAVETQSPILIQVVAKTVAGFTLALNPLPPSPNYYLTVRTP